MLTDKYSHCISLVFNTLAETSVYKLTLLQELPREIVYWLTKDLLNVNDSSLETISPVQPVSQ